MRHGAALFSTGLVALWLVFACGSERDAPSGHSFQSSGGTSGQGGAGKGGKGGRGGNTSGGHAGDGATSSGGDDAEGGSNAAGGDSPGGQAGSSGGSGASGGSGGSGGTSPSGGTTGQAGNLGEAGAGIGANGPVACDSDDAQGAPPAAAGVCVPGAEWGEETPVPVETGPSDPLIAITPDELTIVWFSSSSVLVPYYADRASPDDDFEAPIAAGVDGVVAVSPDGLRLIVQTGDSTLQEATRAARGDSFGAPSAGAFAALNAALEDEALSYVGVAISPDDRTLYYSVMSREGTDYPLHVSVRTGTGAWPVGEVIDACEFEAMNGFGVRPSAVSSDGLTLFYWDNLRVQARAAFRESIDGPFVWFQDLGQRVAPQPNTACDRLYYSIDGPVYAER